MYLTVFRIDLKEPSKALLCIHDQYKLHQWITGILHQNRQEGKILHRIMKKDGYAYLYVQTESPFDTDGFENDGFFFVRRENISSSIAGIEEGEFVYINVLSVPFRRKEDKTRYLKDKEEIRRWFVEKMGDKGISSSPDCYQITPDEEIEFFKNGKYNHLSTYTMSGVMRVDNKDLFVKSVKNGFYRNKCWGAGLILFNPIVQNR